MKKSLNKTGMLLMLFVISEMAWAQQTSRYREHYMMWGDSFYGWLFGCFMMLLFIALATVVIMLVVRAFGGQKQQAMTTENDESTNAISILKKRFASGEIDKEEFERTKEVLEK